MKSTYGICQHRPHVRYKRHGRQPEKQDRVEEAENRVLPKRRVQDNKIDDKLGVQYQKPSEDGADYTADILNAPESSRTTSIV